MARSRKVDADAAMEAATAMFWKHGYCSLGTRQLEEETGITRFTLQTTYGGKMALFLNTLDAYLDQFETSVLIQGAARDLDGVASLFETRVDPDFMPGQSCYGCLVLNSAIEFGSSNEDVNQRISRYLTILRNSFRRGLTQTLRHDNPAARQDIDQKVEILVSAALGLNVIVRAATDNRAGQDMAKSIAGMVRSWR
jgi:TetR/AcrR family transcriptional regulator, transcriptional repressor for nem operon